MSKYNHLKFLRQDFIGELHFVNWKVLNMIFGAITTFILKIDLKTGGGGKIWQEIEM